jgi:hypothetical protein
MFVSFGKYEQTVCSIGSVSTMDEKIRRDPRKVKISPSFNVSKE